MIQTQATYSLGDGCYAYVGGDLKKKGAAISTDGGVHFEGKWWPEGFSADAPPRYGAFPSDKVWYISGGVFPSNNNVLLNPDDYIEISRTIRFNKKKQLFELSLIHI